MNPSAFDYQLGFMPAAARRGTTLVCIDDTFWEIRCVHCQERWRGTPSKCHPSAFERIVRHVGMHVVLDEATSSKGQAPSDHASGAAWGLSHATAGGAPALQERGRA